MKVLTNIDLLALPSLETPPTGHVGFGAKSDGLYQKVGTVETKLSVEGHTHTKSQITDFPTSMPASDVYAWAKAATKPAYTYTEVGAAAASHTHAYLPLTGGTLTGAVTGTTMSLTGIDLLVAGTRCISYYGPAANGYLTQMQTTSTAGYGTHGSVTGDWALYNKFSGTTNRGWIWQLASVNVASISGTGAATFNGSVTAPSFIGALTGNASSATALTSNAGSSTNPIYFSSGKPTASTYSFGNANGNIPISNGTLNTNLNADLLDGKHYSDVLEAIEVAKSTNHGYRYSYNLWIYGDSYKYYPFVLVGGDQNVKRDILIKRSYSEAHPAEWNSATHGGGLTLKLKANFGGWGGANYGWEIHELEEMYNPTFGGCYHTTSYMSFSIMLRGGGTGGAIYHIYSDQPIEVNHPLHLNGDGNTSSSFPQVFYNSDVLNYGTTTHTWAMPSPLTTPNVEDIRRRKFILLAQNIDTLLGGTSGVSSLSITGNASTATKLSSNRTFALTGDVTGTITSDLTSGVSIATTIAANSVALGTDTTGNYAASVGVSGNGLTITGAAGEGTAFIVNSNATNANTGSTLVFRDASGNFSAGTITAALSGNATTATTATKLGTATVGSTQLPFYLNAGTATAITQANLRIGLFGTTAIGSTQLPIYLAANGVPTAITQANLRIGLFGATAIGSATAPVYIAANGTATACTSFGGLTGIGTASPLMDGTVAVGTSTLAARQDHRHPVDTSRAAVGQTMHIGTTAVAINRASATLNLTGIGTLAMGGALSGATTIAASTSVTTPKVIFAFAGWSLEQSGTELQIKYNGVVKQRMLSDGSIVATGEVTAFGSTT